VDDAAVAAVTLVTRRAAAFPHCLETQEALRLDEHFIPLSGAPCCRSLVFSIDRSSSVGVVFPGQRSQPSGSCVAPANSSPAESPRGTGRKSLALKWGADSSVLWFYNTIQYNTIPCNLKSRVPSKWQPAPRMHRSVEKKKKARVHQTETAQRRGRPGFRDSLRSHSPLIIILILRSDGVISKVFFSSYVLRDPDFIV